MTVGYRLLMLAVLAAPLAVLVWVAWRERWVTDWRNEHARRRQDRLDALVRADLARAADALTRPTRTVSTTKQERQLPND